MLNLRLAQGAVRILCLGAHADDIEIGCGGALLRLLSEHPDCAVLWVVFSGTAERAAEARRSADEFLAAAGQREFRQFAFRDGFFPTELAAIKESFEDLKAFRPDLIFTHYREDRHQDHRTVADLTYNTFRDHLVLEYEVLKYDDDVGHPNLFITLDDATRSRKVAAIQRHFASQRNRSWFTAEALEALMRVRGVHSRSPTGCAEAFHCRKSLL